MHVYCLVCPFSLYIWNVAYCDIDVRTSTCTYLNHDCMYKQQLKIIRLFLTITQRVRKMYTVRVHVCTCTSCLYMYQKPTSTRDSNITLAVHVDGMPWGVTIMRYCIGQSRYMISSTYIICTIFFCLSVTT